MHSGIIEIKYFTNGKVLVRLNEANRHCKKRRLRQIIWKKQTTRWVGMLYKDGDDGPGIWRQGCSLNGDHISQKRYRGINFQCVISKIKNSIILLEKIIAENDWPGNAVHHNKRMADGCFSKREINGDNTYSTEL